MLVTPSTEKSNGVSLYLPLELPLDSPLGSMKGMMNDPRQQSTWRPSLYFLASTDSPSILSWLPSGKLIHDPTSFKGAAV